MFICPVCGIGYGTAAGIDAHRDAYPGAHTAPKKPTSLPPLIAKHGDRK